MNFLLFSPNIAGLMGAFLSMLFVIIFTALGNFQKDYMHGKHTVSELVSGKYGWVQNLNFIFLAFAFLSIGYGLGVSVYNNLLNPITISFVVFSFGLFVTAVFPVDKLPGDVANKFSGLNLSEKIHHANLFFMLFVALVMLNFTIKGISGVSHLKSLVSYTIFVFVSNFTASLLWFYFYRRGVIHNRKGWYQKIIIINTIVWLIVIGLKL